VVCHTSSLNALPSTKTLLSKAYTDFDSLQYGIGSYVIPDDDKNKMKELSATQGPKAWTYGEITFEGVQILKQELGSINDGVFYDLGSGLGRMTLQVFLDWAVRRAVGVELSEHRHRRAVRALEQLEPHIKACSGRTIEFRNENLLQSKMNDATVVYLACTCWDADFMQEVMDKLRPLQHLQWIVSTESLATEFGIVELPWVSNIKEVQLPMSWDEDWTVYIYMVSPKE